jgi:hypothetical protein
VSHEPRIGVPEAVIEAITATRFRRAVPEAERSQQQIEALSINTIRTLAMDAVQKANSGHPGTPLALAPVPLYSGTAIFTPEQVAMIKE